MSVTNIKNDHWKSHSKMLFILISNQTQSKSSSNRIYDDFEMISVEKPINIRHSINTLKDVGIFS